MKSVLLSIKPKWCELITSGKKAVEVRKTKPKIETPFKCYIYCTNGKSFYIFDERFECETKGNGKVIGEFVCDFINKYTAEFVDDDCYENIRQIWEDDDFTIVTSNEDENPNNCFLFNASCLSFEDIKKYIGVNFHEIPFYAWHISDLKIYDKPKEISEYVKPCIYGKESERPCFTCDKSGYASDMHLYCFNTVTRPPQSWCYVEELI